MKHLDTGNALVTQKDQVDKCDEKMLELKEHMGEAEGVEAANSATLAEIDMKSEAIFKALGIDRDGVDLENAKPKISLTQEELCGIESSLPHISLVDFVSGEEASDWQTYVSSVESYAERNSLDLTRNPFEALLSENQRKEIEERLKTEYTVKRCSCDKYDYMIAATCGAIGGLIDAFFVGVPGKSTLGSFTDQQTKKVVQRFAKACGWEGPREGSDPAKSAIGFLERKFVVNYDHRHTGDVDYLFSMCPSNHHLKSLGHSPDIVGLFFSILDQFTDKASFVDSGRIIRIDTSTNDRFELRGHTFASKLYCGFINWFGHLMSDLAGASGTKKRGSGIPIPFYGLLQFVNISWSGENGRTLADIAVQVFEQSYDLRHGVTMAIPVALTEVLIRIMWTFKQRFYHEKIWKESMPFGNIAELNRMLLVGHGTLCLIDLADAAIKGGGEPVNILIRMNLIGWVRLGFLGFKEVRSIYKHNDIDTEKIDAELQTLYSEVMVGTAYLN